MNKFWRLLWSTRIVFGGVIGSAVLTSFDWFEHHPADIASHALVHFIVAWTAVAIGVQTMRRLRGGRDGSEMAG
jgi:hypothetical protein